MAGRVYDPIHDVFQDSSKVSEELEVDSNNNNESDFDSANEATETLEDTAIHLSPLSTVNATKHTIDILNDDDDDDDDDDDEDDDDNDSDSSSEKTGRGADDNIADVSLLDENIADDISVDGNKDADDSTQSEDNSAKVAILGGFTDSAINSVANSTTPLDEKKSHSSTTISNPVVKPLIKKKENSKYTRHLKKPDGAFFTRNEIQFEFLKLLMNDKREIFTNIYKPLYTSLLAPMRDLYDDDGNVKVLNVNDQDFDARRFFHHDKLTFSQLYVLSLASSKKCSRILRDKLLSDPQTAFSTCVLGFLVNIGRLNTTINFYLEMTSQLRTFHTAPCLQATTGEPKSLQDTPRLKSILKNIAVGNESINLAEVYDHKYENKEKPNIINIIFALCENVYVVNTKFFNDSFIEFADNETRVAVSLFNLLDTNKLNLQNRVDIIIWLLYIHSETNFKTDEIENSLKMLGHLNKETGKYKLNLSMNQDDQIDIDTEFEIQFGLKQQAKRELFLEKMKTLNKEEKEKDPTNKDSHTGDKRSLKNFRKNLKAMISPNNTTENIPQIPNILGNIKDSDATTSEPSNISSPIKPKDSSILGISQYNSSHTTESTGYTSMQENNDSNDITQNVTSLDTNDIHNEHISKKRKLKDENGITDNFDHENVINMDQINRLIMMDQNKPVNIYHNDKKNGRTSSSSNLNRNKKKHLTQKEYIDRLISIYETMKYRREELGIVKIFNEYEDIPLASMYGIRGKKRKRYRDGLLNFETDFLKVFQESKLYLLRSLGATEEDDLRAKDEVSDSNKHESIKSSLSSTDGDMFRI